MPDVDGTAGESNAEREHRTAGQREGTASPAGERFEARHLTLEE
jgi:hypothetical protein